MNYFIDTEFIEGFKKPIKWLPSAGKFNRPYHFIDLISIGLVCSDGREYYAISNEYNYNDASEWVKENVILPAYTNAVHGDERNKLKVETFHAIRGKNNKQIAREIKEFIVGDGETTDFTSKAWKNYISSKNNPPEFYGYYADYDWVLFCSLFGRMIDLPAGFPMYCRDLKQEMDRLGLDKEWKDKYCPEPENEHNALADARWNVKLHKTIDDYAS